MKKRAVKCIAVLLAELVLLLSLCACGGGDDGGEQDSAPPATVAPSYRTAAVHRIDADYISQVDSYPCGCESVSAVMALNYAGYGIDTDVFIEDYLPMGEEPYYGDDGLLYADSPYEVFIGSPYSDYSYGCYAPVIRGAIERFLTDGAINADPAGAYRVADLSGTSLKELCEDYVSRDIPVIVWGTIGMQPIRAYTTWILPDGSEFTWRSQEHCLLLVGYDEQYYYFNDPMEGKDTKYQKADAEQAYAALYSQALAIVKNE